MKFVKEFIVPAAVLTVICLVVSAALVMTYDTTKPVIEAAKAAEADAARAVVLSGADKFEAVTTKAAGVTEAYKAGNGAGYVFTAKTKGYGGDLFVMVGIKSDGSVDAVKLMENSETPGIGSQAGESSFLNRFNRKTGNDVDSVETISGATISTTAVKTAVKSCFEAYGELAGVEFEAPKSPEEIIFPDVTDFEEITVDGAVKAFKSGDNVLLVTEAQGYSGAPMKMQVYTGFGADGKIVGVYMGENGETTGLGTKVNNDDHRAQYVGKENTDGVDAISGATESSDGMKAAVNKAVELYATMSAAPAEGEALADGESVPADGDAPAEGAESAVDDADASSAASGS